MANEKKKKKKVLEGRFRDRTVFQLIIIVIYSIYFQVFKFFWTYWTGYLLAMASLMSFIFPEKIRKKIQYFFNTLWAKGLIVLGGVRYKVEVSPKVDFHKAYLYVGNHTSALDIYLYHTVIHSFANWIAKRSLFNVPFLGTSMWLLGHVPVYRDEDMSHVRKTLDLGVRRLKEGYSLCVFPEGTRSYGGELLPFKKGAFTMAKMAKTQIVPVVTQDAWRVAPKGQWITDPFVVVKIKILDPVDYTDKDTVENVRNIVQNTLDNM